MKLSILCPVFNQLAFTKQVIKSIEENISWLIDYEIIILNNWSTDGTKEYSKNNNDFNVINLSENIFVNPAWNYLAQEAEWEYLLFLNNDITLFKNFDLKLLSYHEDGKIVCPATCQSWESTWFRQWANINWTCFLVKKVDYISIPNEIKLWFGDDILFRTLWVIWINEWVVHFWSQTLSTLPEVNKIIANDQKEYIRICKERNWQDKRFPETLI